MINQQLLDFIKQQTALGKSREEIKQSLMQTGWKEADIEEGFKATETGAPAPAISQQGELPKASDIFKNTWELYKQRLGVLIGIYLIPYILIVALIIVLAILGALGVKSQTVTNLSLPYLLIIGLIALVVIFYIGTWGAAALIVGIRDSKEKIGIIETYKRAKSKIIPLFFANLLIGLAILGIILVFYVISFLLITILALSAGVTNSILNISVLIVGIIIAFILAIRWSQTPYIIINEDTRVLAALGKSKQYIKGRFWPVTGKLVFILLISILLSIIFGFLGGLLFGNQDSAPKSILNAILNVLWVPFTAIYSYLLYTHIKATAK